MKRRKKLKVLYTNADGFMNKKDELVLRICNTSKPHIIAITEFIPKGQKNAILFGDIFIKGYQGPFTNFELGMTCPGKGKRGIALYVCDTLPHVEEIKYDFTHFEQVCICLLDIYKRVGIGVWP